MTLANIFISSNLIKFKLKTMPPKKKSNVPNQEGTTTEVPPQKQPEKQLSPPELKK
jgi:hypothetical protein